MTGHHVGPFGQSWDSPYQLPPWRAPPNLPFGADSLLHQRQQREEVELARETAQPHQRGEQLPSVRQLLTPVTDPSSSPSLFQPYPPPAPSIEHRDYPYPFRHHGPVLASQLPVVARQARQKSRSESLPHSRTRGLPPLSEVAPREMRHHAATRSDPSTASQLPLHSPPYHKKALSGDMSSPEAASRSKLAPVLPHVVDERYIEGEGLCYIYADGSYCPKIIEGVPVNANWGVTKAGKPRKRLAQACLTCREKKIKCRPNSPKCDQCQKSGRECRFESASRGNRSSMRGSHSAGQSGKYDAREGSSPGHYATSDVSMYDLVRAPGSATSLSGLSGHSQVSDSPMVTSLRTEAQEETTPDAKRVYNALARGGEPLPRRAEHVEAKRLPEYSDILDELRENNLDVSLEGSWNVDPYERDPDMTAHYVECFLSNVNDTLYHIFPRARFVLWLSSCRAKSADDKMLLYSMMALGSVFSDRPDRVVALRRYSRIARLAIQKRQHALSLQLAQSHIIMGLWYYAMGFVIGTWDSIGAAGRAVSALRYNMESGGVVVDRNQICDYGLHPQAMMECRRRTFWVFFILDRFSTLLSASSTFISSESALVRLPCRDEIYEAQRYATTPYFQSALNQSPIPTEDDCSAVSPMAFFIQILSIWGDVSLHSLRLSHTPSDAYTRLAEEFHANIMRRTDDWFQRLPGHLTFSNINLARASQAKEADAFVSIHLFYQGTLMKLHRHARYQNMRSGVLVQYIRQARFHAIETLRIAMSVAQYVHDVQQELVHANTDAPSPKMTHLSPFAGYAVLSAIDVLSAAGPMSELPDCISSIRGSLGMIQLLGRHWNSSLQLVNSIQRRLDIMIECASGCMRVKDKLGFSVDGPSLETTVHTDAPLCQSPGVLDDDLFYGSMPRETLLHVMQVDDCTFSENSIAWLKDR